MKAIITALVVVGAVVVGVYFLNNRSAQVYERENTVEVIPEVKEQWQTDEDAVQAAKDVIKKKELQAELKQLDEDIKVKQEQRKKVADELTTYWSAGKVKAFIRQTFGKDAVTAIAVAMAESGLNPYALNAKDSHKGCKGSYGIFQIGCLHEKDPFVLYDVEYNIKRAKEIYDQSGWQPWGAHTDGSYLAYLR